jgi:hypothetical protein
MAVFVRIVHSFKITLQIKQPAIIGPKLIAGLLKTRRETKFHSHRGVL